MPENPAKPKGMNVNKDCREACELIALPLQSHSTPQPFTRMLNTDQKEFTVQILAQGHADTWLKPEVRELTFRLER